MKKLLLAVAGCLCLAGCVDDSFYEPKRKEVTDKLSGQTIQKAVYPNGEDLLLILDNGEAVVVSDPGGWLRVKVIQGDKEPVAND